MCPTLPILSLKNISAFQLAINELIRKSCCFLVGGNKTWFLVQFGVILEPEGENLARKFALSPQQFVL